MWIVSVLARWWNILQRGADQYWLKGLFTSCMFYPVVRILGHVVCLFRNDVLNFAYSCWWCFHHAPGSFLPKQNCKSPKKLQITKGRYLSTAEGNVFFRHQLPPPKMAFPPHGPNGLGVEISLLESNRKKNMISLHYRSTFKTMVSLGFKFLEKICWKNSLGTSKFRGSRGSPSFQWSWRMWRWKIEGLLKGDVA